MIYFTRARLFGKLMLVKELIDPEADMKFPHYGYSERNL